MISRYSRPEMASLWTAEARYTRWLDIELSACEAMAELGLVPKAAAVACRARAGEIGAADAVRIDEIERTVKHDVIAFLTFLEERIGPEARYLHLGMTSSDVLDTALSLQLAAAGKLLLEGLDLAREAVRRRAMEHRHTPMIGRSHGIHAEPMTFGHKLAIWYDELGRGRGRLVHALEGVRVGKISGAVGTFANVPPAVEEIVCRRLGLLPAPASSQIVQRDRHAELFSALALVGASLEKFAVEIRHLMRTEVREVDEPFTQGQKGSSAMPHKRNPILSENLTGLARLLRGYAVAALEDVALWHERDISHSSVERVIAPDATILLDFMLSRFARLVGDLRVNADRMRENLGLTRGIVFSQQLLLELARRGLPRQQAYSMVQRNALKALDEGIDFEGALAADPDIRAHLGEGEIHACFDVERQLRHVDVIFKRVFGE
ncbi:MAG: adenylosuccinate lyase [Deltaproteobacteria bacterium]